MIVVNGPIASRIGLNSGTNALGRGFQSNASIGRGLRLILQNIGGAIPGKTDMATLGQPGKYTYCFAENESHSPWPSLATSLGYKGTGNVVTAIPANGSLEIRDSDSEFAEDLIWTISHSILSAGLVGPQVKQLLKEWQHRSSVQSMLRF